MMLKKYKVAIVAVAGIITAIAIIIFVREASPLVTAPPPPVQKPAPFSTSQPKIKALIQIRILSKNGRTIKIIVHWENLPEGTTELDIFRSLSQDDIGTLIKTISIDANSLTAGNATLSFSGGQGSYFYGSSISNNGSTLWTSSSTQPTTTLTPAPPPPPSPSPPTLSLPPPPPPPSPLPPPSPPSSPSSQPSSTSSSAITYYTPQGTVSGSSAPQTANFLVQHIDQKIQIGWQNLPSDTDRLIVSRSASTNGPWTAILTQKNLVTDAPYSLQIVDNTLNSAYYYKLDVYHASILTITYGPIFLGPISE